MASLTDILNTSRDALAAQSYGLGVTGQNVANVNTPGYVRRRAVLQAEPLGSQSFGSVSVKGLARLADTYTEQRHYAAIGLSTAAAESNRLLGYMEAQFDVTSGIDIGTAMSELYSAFSTLSTNPGDVSARTQVLGKAQTFSEMLNRASNEVSAFRTGLFEEAAATTRDVNQLTKQIADVTGKISMAEAAGHDASDLKDNRDRMLLDLSELVDVRTFTNGAGQMVVQGAGTTLVEGDVARALDVGLDNDGMLQIFAVSKTGARTNVSNYVTGGKLAAVKETRDVDALSVLRNLDQLAYDVATGVNAQHELGYTLDGETGVSFFDVSGGLENAARNLKVHDDVVGQPTRIAAASTLAGVPGNADNAIALSQLSHNTLANGGTQTGAEAYGSLLADLGTRRQSAAADAEVREAITAQVYAMRESVSGVNLDEEMVALTKYQRAYEAAARVLTTADELLEHLINTLGRRKVEDASHR